MDLAFDGEGVVVSNNICNVNFSTIRHVRKIPKLVTVLIWVWDSHRSRLLQCCQQCMGGCPSPWARPTQWLGKHIFPRFCGPLGPYLSSSDSSNLLKASSGNIRFKVRHLFLAKDWLASLQLGPCSSPWSGTWNNHQKRLFLRNKQLPALAEEAPNLCRKRLVDLG